MAMIRQFIPVSFSADWRFTLYWRITRPNLTQVRRYRILKRGIDDALIRYARRHDLLALKTLRGWPFALIHGHSVGMCDTY